MPKSKYDILWQLSAVHFYKLQIFEFVFAFQIMRNTGKNAACLRGVVMTATVGGLCGSTTAHRPAL
ncbi:MAG TPA: hypothetical protein PLC90_06900 [Bacteroidales bacterium]|nr:hypothetical protein [Bacteroidales bacterium]